MSRIPSAPRESAAAALCAIALCAVACQPVDDVTVRSDEPSPTAAEAPLGAPVRGMPATLAALVARAEPAAREWQDEPRLAQIRVEVTASGVWRRASLLYLAAGADRLLTVTVEADGVRRELSTLATLGLRPVSVRGLRQLPELPPGTREPGDLLDDARPLLRRCGMPARPEAVLYGSGAPAAWNGRRWTIPPAWAATVLTPRGAIELDPVTGELRRCVEPSEGS